MYKCQLQSGTLTDDDIMPVVTCIRCEARFNAKPAAMQKPGYFSLCARCRADIPREDGSEYLCNAKNTSGQPCRQIHMLGHKTCVYHQKLK